MRRRSLGRSGPQISEFCFGTWQLGGARFGPIDARAASRLLQRAAELGVNAFDMSNMYGNGRAEAIVGCTFAQRRDEFIYITKAGYLTGIDGAQELIGEPQQCFGPGDLTYSCKESLARLQTDMVDVFLLHDPPAAVLGDERIWAELESLKTAGLVGAYGASTSPSKAVRAIQRGAEVVEVLLNLVKQDAATVVLPLAEARGVGVLARSPFHNGALLKLDGAGTAVFATGENRVDTSLRYVTGIPGVSSIVVGVQTRAELEEDAAVFERVATTGEPGLVAL